MITVNGKVLNPPTSATVTIALVDYGNTQVIGFDTVDQATILAPYTVVPAADGTWTVQLVPNANIQLVGGAALTAWRVTESAVGVASTYWIVVPPTGGPYWVGDLRTTLVGPQPPNPTTNLAISGALSVGGVFTLDGVALGAPPNDASKFLCGTGAWVPGGGAVSSVNGHTGVVVLNSTDVGAVQASLATTKGDVLAATGASTLARVGVGPDGDLLVADSSQAAGVGWKVVSRDQHASKLGLLLEPFPVETISEIAPGLGLVSGNLYGQLSRPASRQALWGVGIWLTSAGSGATGSSYVALLDESGNRLGVSADITSYLTDVTNEGKFVELPFTSPTAVLDPDTGYYPTVLSNLSSIPKIAGCLPSAGTFSIPKMRGHLPGWFLGGQSSVPSSVNVATVTTTVASYYIVGLPAPS